MSEAKQLDARMLQWQDQLGTLADTNREQVKRAIAQSISTTLADLRVAYSKFNASEGNSNRYTIESQTTRFRELTKAADGLLDPGTMKSVQSIYERDLNDAYSIGTSASRDLSKIVDGAETSASAKISKMPIGAQAAAGQSLMQFWDKEKAALTSKVTEATLSALQRGKGWGAAQKDIANALRSDGQTILRGKDELSVTARNGIVMSLEKRADLIAKTELANAYIQGQMAQYRKNGYEYGRWSATGERSCPFCVAREGNIYTLDELEGAIPAHPRCRCTIAPVLGENVKNVQNATDKEAAAALNLDDAGWTAIRQQRFSEFQKFTGKPMNDPAKYINTPTSRQKFFNPQAKGDKPAWMPSGKAVPDLNSVQAAAGRAAEQATKSASKELTAEEKIVNDVMNDKRFKSDAQRTREMRARLGEAGLNRDLDFVKVAADARAKTQGKSTAKDLEAQKAEAKKAEEIKKADAKKAQEAEAKKAAAAKEAQEAKLKETIERAEQRVKDAKARLDMAKAALPTWKKMRPEAEADFKAKQAEATRLGKEYAAASKEVDALKKEVAKHSVAAGDRRMKLQKLNESIDAATLKAQTLKANAASPGSSNSGLSDLEYGQKVARMAHTPESLARMSQDVLDRAGVKLKDLRSSVKTKAEIDKAIDNAEFFGKSARADIARTTERLNEAKAKLKKMPAEDKWMIEQVIDIHTRNIKDATKKAEMWEKDAKDLKAQRSKAPDKNPALDAAQKVINELKRTSPLSAGDALNTAKTLSTESNWREKISTRGRFQAPPNYTDLADAAQMFGSFNNLRAYGVTGARGHAAEPAYDKLTNRFLENAPLGESGLINAGQGKTGDTGRFRKTTFHELGHFVEFSNADIYVAAKRFIGDHIKPGRMKPGKLKGYGASEKFFQAKEGYEPVNPYVLKDYTPAINGVSEMDGMVYNLQKGQIPARLQRLRDATEVTSMGLETLSDPTRLAGLAAKDVDHLMFTLGSARLAQARASAGIKHFNYEDFQNTPHARAENIPASKKSTAKSTPKSNSAKEIRDVEATIKKLEKERDAFFDLDWDLDPENLLDQANEKLGKIGDIEDLRQRAGRAQVDANTAQAKLDQIVDQISERTARIARNEKDLADYMKDLSAFLSR